MSALYESSVKLEMNGDSQTDTYKKWEDLRRTARQLENDLDKKLFEFSRLMVTKKEQSKKNKSQSDESEPLMGVDSEFNRLSTEVESLLAHLEEVNQQMSQHCRTESSSTVLYTLQRHQEIYKDYSREFHKTRSNLEEHIKREMLLGNSKRDKDEFSFGGSPKHHGNNDYLMRESESIQSSQIMIDDQINIAIRTRDSLRNQRNAMKSIQTQLTTLANKFPMIQGVLQRIDVKKRKDTIILGAVIGLCLFLFIIYVF